MFLPLHLLKYELVAFRNHVYKRKASFAKVALQWPPTVAAHFGRKFEMTVPAKRGAALTSHGLWANENARTPFHLPTTDVYLKHLKHLHPDHLSLFEQDKFVTRDIALDLWPDLRAPWDERRAIAFRYNQMLRHGYGTGLSEVSYFCLPLHLLSVLPADMGIPQDTMLRADEMAEAVRIQLEKYKAYLYLGDPSLGDAFQVKGTQVELFFSWDDGHNYRLLHEVRLWLNGNYCETIDADPKYQFSGVAMEGHHMGVLPSAYPFN